MIYQFLDFSFGLFGLVHMHSISGKVKKNYVLHCKVNLRMGNTFLGLKKCFSESKCLLFLCLDVLGKASRGLFMVSTFGLDLEKCSRSLSKDIATQKNGILTRKSTFYDRKSNSHSQIDLSV